jgi:hypothetical protein
MNGLYYITGISQSIQGAGGYNTFTYANSGSDVARFKPAAGKTSISNTGTSKADGIVAGANFLRLENLNIEGWGRFGINATSDSAAYWADNQSFRNITIEHCRGIGLYVRSGGDGDSNASDFSQMYFNVILVGGIYNFGSVCSTHVAPGLNYCGGGWESANGPALAVQSVSCRDNVVTVKTRGAHGFEKGQAVVLSGLADSSFEAPPGSAVFVASESSTSFTYNFTHANGAAGPGGSARLANATELYTLAGTGQHPDGRKGTGFSYWAEGAAGLVFVNPYAENANGPAKFGKATLTIAGNQARPWLPTPSGPTSSLCPRRVLRTSLHLMVISLTPMRTAVRLFLFAVVTVRSLQTTSSSPDIRPNRHSRAGTLAMTLGPRPLRIPISGSRVAQSPGFGDSFYSRGKTATTSHRPCVMTTSLR